MSHSNSLQVLKFLTEVCLLCDPRTLDDDGVSVSPRTGFLLDLCPLQKGRDELPRRALRSSKRRPPGGESSAVALALVEHLEAGRRSLDGGDSEEVAGRRGRSKVTAAAEEGVESDVLMRLWCALVCLQYAK